MTDRPIIIADTRPLLDGRQTQLRRIATANNLLIDGHPIGRNPGVGKSMRWIFDALDWSRAWVDGGPSPARNPGPYWHVPCLHPDADGTSHRLYPKWQKGDRLWVRERIGRRVASCLGIKATNGVEEAFYVADDDDVVNSDEFNICPWWKSNGAIPGIHMPRWASRLTLTVTDVRVQRLQEISEADAIAEGATSRPACQGFLNRDEGWSMDWSRVGKPSKGARGGRTLTERDIALVTARHAFGFYWDSVNGASSWKANPWVIVLTFTTERRNIDSYSPEQRRADAPLRSTPSRQQGAK